jgi:hypothetical protein
VACWLLCLLFIPLAAAHQTVLLHFRNGDRLTGELLAEDPSGLTVSNAVLGRLRIPAEQVAKREWVTNTVAVVATTPAPTHTNTAAAGKPPAGDSSAARRYNALLADYVAGKISAAEYHQQRARLLAEVGPDVGPHPKPVTPPLAAAVPKPKHWTGEAQMGTDLSFNQKDRQNYTGRLKLNYLQAPVRHNFDYLATYGKVDDEITANRMDGFLKTDYDLKKDWYLYSLLGGGYDELRKIDWRYEVGPGLGYHAIRLTNLVLRVESGFHYEVQNFQDNRQDEVYYHRFAQDLRWNLGTLVSFDERVEYFPELDTLREYKLRMEANLRLWLRNNLYFNLTVINLYDTVTAPGVGQNDLQIKSSVGVRF